MAAPQAAQQTTGDSYPLSHAQQRELITEVTYPGTPFANIVFAVRFTTAIDFGMLEQAINLFISRHAGIRLRLRQEGYDYRQYPVDDSARKIDYFDFSSDFGRDRYATWLTRQNQTPFTLLDADLFYFALLKYPDGATGFYYRIHHIIADGWTAKLIIDGIVDTYRRLAAGEEPDGSPAPCYTEYLAAENEYLQSAAAAADRAFWLNKYATLPPEIILPYNRAKESGIKAEERRYVLPRAMTAALSAYYRDTGVSPTVLFLSAITVYLAKITGHDDVTLGVLTRNRNTRREKQMVGMFVNTLPLRYAVDPELTFSDYAQRNTKELTAVQRHHARYPYDLLAKDLREKHGSVPNLLNIIVAGQNFTYAGVKAEYLTTGYEQPPYHLLIYPAERYEDFELHFTFPAGMYTDADIARMHGHIVRLAGAVLADRAVKIADLDIITDAERAEIMETYNRTDADFPRDTTVVALFNAAARRHAERPAVAGSDGSMTYRELNARANQVARRLVPLGAGRDAIVAIMLDQRAAMVPGILGILKSGAAYLPIDPAYPAARIQQILRESNAIALLSTGALCGKAGFAGPVIDLTDPGTFTGDDTDLPVTTAPADLAYVIYTSGSTGKPKGAMLEHRNLLNNVMDCLREFALTENDRTTKFAGFAFDVSIDELFPTLLAGAALHIVPADIRMDPEQVRQFFVTHGITSAFLPTQFAEQFMALTGDTALRVLLTGGDKLKTFTPRPYRLVNGYGPTECTVYATFFTVDRQYDNIPIGRPCANYRIYIVDRRNHLLPVGVPGELCIAGAGVGRGYLNNPEKTAAAFVDNPFVPGTKMYRTGDLARWRDDGNIEFLGRIDFQVKIRGFRIEIGEIESCLLQHPAVSEAIVVARERAGGDKYLCGYYVAAGDLAADALKEMLGAALPEYMIPAFLVPLPRMPLNPNGKIDRKALPEPVLAGELVRPANSIEEQLLALWQEVLGLDRISTESNFFDLGGHSLSATMLAARISTCFGVEVPLASVFRYPTIRAFAPVIQGAHQVRLATIDRQPEQEHYPVTSAQKRLFIIGQLQGIGTTYNIPCVFALTGELDEGRLSRALDRLIARHEALRTSFALVQGEPVQRIHREVRYKKTFREIADDELAASVAAFVKPFDLQAPPLFRLLLLKVTARQYYLVFDLHHAIFDGTSIPILLRDLVALYAERDLPELRVQYRDYAVWHTRLLASGAITEQERFWRERFAGDLPVLDLPADFTRPALLDYAGDTFASTLDETLTGALRELAQRRGVTPNILLLAAYAVLLHKYAAAEDVIIGIGSAGRSHVDVQHLVGMFVNTLPFRARPESGKLFTAFLDEVRHDFLDALENQDYPFEQLVQQLQLARDPGRNPLFDVGMVYQGSGAQEQVSGGLRFSHAPYTHHIAHLDLLLEVCEHDTTMTVNWEYRTSLFQRATIGRLAGHFRTILRALVRDPEQAIADIDLLTASEIDELLYAHNQTDADYPREMTVHARFEEMAARFPERVAVTYKERALTYRELNARANRLARTLRARGVVPDSIVALITDIRPEMIVAILAIIKAGGCYLPMKPEFPRDRIEFMLENSGARLLLTTREFFELAGSYRGNIIDFMDEAQYAPEDANLSPAATAQHLLYIIYTSGSTGRPKGVMLEHGNILRLFVNDRFQYQVDEHDVWSMFHSFCFDFSVWEMYGALLYGGRVVMAPKEVIIEPAAFVQLCKREKVTVLSQTPGAFYKFIEEDLRTADRDLALRYVTFGGEALKPALLGAWHERYPATRLINMYGITETTVHVTFKEITAAEITGNISNIGVPIPTLRTYIMDGRLRLLPPGVPGEICVAGDGLARGYLGLPDVTGEKFVENPYIAGERIYRSGDLARRLANGELEYLGRIDFQVKIRGFRIELGEIESRLLHHPDLTNVVVLARPDEQGAAELVAYYSGTRTVAVAEFRRFLAADLPDYMIPSYFMKLDELPLTANGKVDRKKLPALSRQVDTGGEYVASATAIEQKLAATWQRVLGVAQVGMLDNFFDLGGHSLKAVALVAELQKEFEVSVNDIFNYPTIAKLAPRVKLRENNIQTRLARLREMPLIPGLLFAETDLATYHLHTAEIDAQLQAYHERATAYAQRDYAARRDYRTMMLTGATGYLGSYLLYQLLRTTTAQLVLPVRAATDDLARQRVQESMAYYFGDGFLDGDAARIRVVRGDLTEPNLGLDEATCRELQETVDCIINPAANVRHYGKYEDFHRANVETVSNLGEFALAGRKKDLHHVSTLSVAVGTVAGREFALYTEFDDDIGQQLDHVYVKTKFAAEKVIRQLRERGLNASIYRVGNITFDTLRGRVQKNVADNAFFQTVRAYVNLGAVPDRFDEADLSFVDQLALAIVTLFDRTALTNETFHLFNPHWIKLSDVLGSPEFGLNIRRLAFPEFVGLLSGHYGRPGFKEHIDNLLLHQDWLAQEDGALQTRNLLTNTMTLTALGACGFAWPELEPVRMRELIGAALAERAAFLRTVPLFNALSGATVTNIAAAARLEHCAEGQDLVFEQQANDRLFLVAEGTIELQQHSCYGWLGTIGVVSASGFLGEDCLLENGMSPVTAEVILGDARVYTLDRTVLLSLMRDDPDVGCQFLKAVIAKSVRLQKLIF